MGAASSNVSLKYQCSSVLSLETIGGTVIDSRFIAQKTDLIGRVLLGDNIRNIIKAVWPDIDENTNPTVYSRLMVMLRTALSMQYDSKDPRLLTITFTDASPEICYKVVRAAIDTIEKSNRQASAKELETGMVFLKKQIEFYRSKIKALDEEMSKIKSELKEKSSQLSSRERDLIEEIIGGNVVSASGLSASAQKAVKYEEILADLNLQLLEAERKKEDIQKQLKSGVFLRPFQGNESIEDDTFIKEYSRAIADKELEVARLLSQGYTSEHPHVARLHKEIAELESLKTKRTEELTTPSSSETSENVKKQQERSAKATLQNIDFQVEMLKDKIGLMEQYKKGITNGQDQIQSTDLSRLASRLTELRGEKEISVQYYSDLRRELEAADIKRRLEREEIFHIRIIEEPKIPLTPMPFQTARKLLMGIVFAIAAGVALAYIVDSLDNSVKTSSELRELLQIPVLAAIDKINMPQEIKARHLQRNISAVSLIILAIASNFVARFGMLRFFFK